MGRLPDNVGNLLVVDHLPTTIRLVVCVAYGTGTAPISLRLSRKDVSAPPVLEHQARIGFVPAGHIDLPAGFSGQIGMPALSVEEPALYWLAVSTDEGPAITVLIYIADRASWAG